MCELLRVLCFIVCSLRSIKVALVGSLERRYFVWSLEYLRGARLLVHGEVSFANSTIPISWGAHFTARRKTHGVRAAVFHHWGFQRALCSSAASVAQSLPFLQSLHQVVRVLRMLLLWRPQTFVFCVVAIFSILMSLNDCICTAADTTWLRRVEHDGLILCLETTLSIEAEENGATDHDREHQQSNPILLGHLLVLFFNQRLCFQDTAVVSLDV